MKNTLLVVFLLFALIGFSQPRTELTPQGFASVVIPKPSIPAEKINDVIRAWAAEYNKSNEYGYDIYDVTASSLSIDSQKDRAFYYTNRGETYHHRIKYTLKVVMIENSFDVTFILKEVYTKKTLTEMTVSDFFAPDGRLKEDYTEVKPSLEKTANSVIKSFYNYMLSAN